MERTNKLGKFGYYTNPENNKIVDQINQLVDKYNSDDSFTHTDFENQVDGLQNQLKYE